MLNQVKLDKYPAFADLGTGDFSRTGFRLERDRMNFEQFGGLLKGEGAHGITSKNKPSQRTCLRHPRYSRQSRRPLEASLKPSPALFGLIAEQQ